MEEVKIDKLVHGGQALGTLPDGRKVFVWNALPGETVRVRVTKSKKGYAEAIAEEIISSSPDRIPPKEPNSYLATSPWQIMSFEVENRYKKEILSETFQREGIELPPYEFVSDSTDFGYRNKMEFGFWGDEEGLSLAHFVRGTHGKTKVKGSVLARDSINRAAADIVAELARSEVRAGDIKALILRSSQDDAVAAALFVKPSIFPRLDLPTSLKGLVVYHSNPKSPASVPTKLLQESGERMLKDTILGHQLKYDVLSFFQVNLPVFARAVQQIDMLLKDKSKIDFYSGVGSIGVLVTGTKLLVENDEANIAMAKQNAGDNIDVVHVLAEKALEYVNSTDAVIVDPPRAGLHADLTARINEAQPPLVAYLSCNPITQARDIKLLESYYEPIHFSGYNFFPRTPHIESLAILRLRSK